jgi:hypothetical protein
LRLLLTSLNKSFETSPIIFLVSTFSIYLGLAINNSFKLSGKPLFSKT